MLSGDELGVNQMMQLPVSHGRLFLIKLIAEMETFHDILAKYAVAHIHPMTLADHPSESTSLLGVHAHHPPADITVRFSMGCHLDKLHFTVWW